MKQLYFLLLLFILVGTSLAFAQGEAAFIAEPSAATYFGVGGRAVGMSEAVIVSIKDGTAIVYNPAALTKIRRPEVYLAMSHEKFNNETEGPALSGTNLVANDITKTRFASLNLTVPVPTYRGALVVAFGVNRTRSFDRVFTFLSETPSETQRAYEEESGGLREYAAAGAIELSPRISVGATLIYYRGGEDYFWNYRPSDAGGFVEYRDNIEDTYSGIGARLGMHVDMSPNIAAAITVDAPTKFNIEEVYTLRTITNGSSEEVAGFYEYDLSHPFIFNAGVAYQSNTFLIEGNIGYADWSQMEYSGDLVDPQSNLDLQNSYEEAINLRFGGELIFPSVGFIARAGFKHDPLPISDFFLTNQVEKDRNSFSIGLSYLIDRVAMLDIAFARASYEIHDIPSELVQNYTSNKLMASIAYRM